MKDRSHVKTMTVEKEEPKEREKLLAGPNCEHLSQHKKVSSDMAHR